VVSVLNHTMSYKKDWDVWYLVPWSGKVLANEKFIARWNSSESPKSFLKRKHDHIHRDHWDTPGNMGFLYGITRKPKK
jgi:hypothetical protein